MKINVYGDRETLTTRDIQAIFHCNATRARAIGYKHGMPYHQAMDPKTGRVQNRFTAAGIWAYSKELQALATDKTPPGYCTRKAAAAYLSCDPRHLDYLVKKGYARTLLVRLAPLNRLQRVFNVADIKGYVNNRHSYTYFRKRNIDPHTGRPIA